MTTLTEADVEQAALDWLSALGWQVAPDGFDWRRTVTRSGGWRGTGSRWPRSASG